MEKNPNQPPSIAKWLLYNSISRRDRDFVIGDFEEFFNEILKESGSWRAKSWYWKQALKSIPQFVYNFIYWKIVMIRSYIRTAYRSIIKNISYATVNVLGLAIGISYSIFILLFVLFEFSYDNYHDNVDRSFVVGMSSKSEVKMEYTGGNSALMIPALKDKYPQIAFGSRINRSRIVTVKHEDVKFREQQLWHADGDILQILSIPLIHGSRSTALNRTNTVVVSEEMAAKYFGSKDPIGESIQIGERTYEVTGVAANAKANTQFGYDMIMSWKTVENDEWQTQWSPGMAASQSLIQLKAGVDAIEFEQLISNVPHEYMGEELEEMGLVNQNFLFPIKDQHLYSLSDRGIVASQQLVYVNIFSFTAILVLLIACLNYMNLSTARFAKRSMEIGIRKVIGASRKQMIGQFLGESVFITLVASLIALLMVFLSLPAFSQLINMDYATPDLLRLEILGGVAAITIVTGLISGSYPAVVLSGFRPVAVLKGTLKNSRTGGSMRRGLVVGQFAISITIVIATLLVYKQISFMKNQPLGFSNQQKLVFVAGDFGLMTENYEAVKATFLNHPAISEASASSGVPGSFINQTWVYPENEEREKGQAFRSLRCDASFTDVYKIEMLAGRTFSKDIPTDVHGAVIINEAGAKAFGWSTPEEAIGQYLSGHNKIVGVCANFHWWGLQQPIEPIVLRLVPSLFQSVTLTVNTDDMVSTIADIEGIHAKLFPEAIFDYFFVDENFTQQYQFEERIFNVFMVFTGLGLFIASLGLVGLASFVVEQRTREMAVRKIYGASVRTVYTLLSKEFLIWILAGSIIAIPLVYMAGQLWLESFAYRVDFGWTMVLLAIGFIVLISAVTISWQVIRASSRNAVEALNFNG